MDIPGNIRERFTSSVNPTDFAVTAPTFSAGSNFYDPTLYTNTVSEITDQTQINATADLASATLDNSYLTNRLIEETKQAELSNQDAADYRKNQTDVALAYQDTVKDSIASNDNRASGTQDTLQTLINNTKLVPKPAAGGTGSSTGGTGGASGTGSGDAASAPPRESLLTGLQNLLYTIMKIVLVIALFTAVGLGIKWVYDHPEETKKFFNYRTQSTKGGQMPKYKNSYASAIF